MQIKTHITPKQPKVKQLTNQTQNNYADKNQQTNNKQKSK